jgi:hypothetical protein
VITVTEMSFGYSVLDIIHGANLSYKLIKALSETRGPIIECQEAIRELDLVRNMFLEIGRMKSCNLLGQATINSSAHITLSSIETIDTFLKKTKQYNTGRDLLRIKKMQIGRIVG